MADAYRSVDRVVLPQLSASLRKEIIERPELRVAIQLGVFFDELKQEQDQGNLLDPKIIVDGRVERRPTRMRPGGQITAVDPGFDFLETAVKEAWSELLRRSPVGTRDKPWAKYYPKKYRDAHVILINGNEFTGNIDDIGQELKNPDTDVVNFVNTQPYARKLENLGPPKPGYVRVQRPNGNYQFVRKKMARKFRGVVQFQFTYLELGQLGVTYKDKSRGKDRLLVYPSLRIRAYGGPTAVLQGAL